MRIGLDMREVPKKWYNVIPDLDFSVGVPMGSSGYPLTQHDLEQWGSSAIIAQELERRSREVSIPSEVAALYAEWRPTPLHRAEQFEKVLGTPARIFFKYEGTSPSGGHEMNTAIPQAFFASRDQGVKCIVTATATGEWGASLAAACNRFGLKCKIYMVRSSYEEKVFGRYAMEILGAEVIPSPSDQTRSGKKVLSQDPASPGGLSIALSEAFEEAGSRADTKFSWGTVMNHVLLHQSIIGLEAREQLRRDGGKPDIFIGAVGGGSGFGGLVFPFLSKLVPESRIIAVETESAPSLSKGRYAYDYTDAEGLAPLLKMYTLGHGFVSPGIRAGGMRYHGISPLVSALYNRKKIEARAYSQKQAFEAAIAFARAEGLIPSPESSYAVKAVVDEALICKQQKQKKDILFLLDANSNLDLESFQEFVQGATQDHPFVEAESLAALDQLPEISAE